MAETDQGEVQVVFVTDRVLGVIDFYISLTPGIELPSYSRVLPNDTGTEYLFTHFQPSDMSNHTYEKYVVDALEEELQGLKKIIESK